MENGEGKLGTEPAASPEAPAALPVAPVPPAQPAAEPVAVQPNQPASASVGPAINVTVGEHKPEAVPISEHRKKNPAYQIIDLVFWVGSALILLRFAFKLAGANPDNVFVKFIYNITKGSVGIFMGIVQNIHLSDSTAPNAYVIEISALIAWLVFWILYVIVRKITAIVLTNTKK